MQNQVGDTAMPQYEADTDREQFLQRCRQHALENNPFFSRIRTYDPETGERYLSVWDPDWPEDWREQIDRQTMQLNEFFVAEILRTDDEWDQWFQSLTGDNSDGQG